MSNQRPEFPDITVQIQGRMTSAQACPGCGGVDLLVMGNDAANWVECQTVSCGHRGPAVGSARDALAAWNAASETRADR